VLDVLLLDGQYRQSLTCMRTLAKAGLAVGAAAYASESEWAPTFRSRWCSMSAALPDVAEGQDVFVDAVLALLDTVQLTCPFPLTTGLLRPSAHARRKSSVGAPFRWRAMRPWRSPRASREHWHSRGSWHCDSRSIPVADVADLRAALNECWVSRRDEARRVLGPSRERCWHEADL